MPKYPADDFSRRNSVINAPDNEVNRAMGQCSQQSSIDDCYYKMLQLEAGQKGSEGWKWTELCKWV